MQDLSRGLTKPCCLSGLFMLSACLHDTLAQKAQKANLARSIEPEVQSAYGGKEVPIVTSSDWQIAQPRLVVEWVKPASNYSHPHSRVVVAQTCGHGAYRPLLAETRRVNERFASGPCMWPSTFNKAFILRAVLMDETKYEILFYMDADAMVINPSFPILASFPLDYGGRRTQNFLLAAHGSSDKDSKMATTANW